MLRVYVIQQFTSWQENVCELNSTNYHTVFIFQSLFITGLFNFYFSNGYLFTSIILRASKSELHFSIKVQVKYSQWLMFDKIIYLVESAKELSDKQVGLAWKISFARERGSVVKKVWKKLGQMKVNRNLWTLGFIKLPEKGANFPNNVWSSKLLHRSTPKFIGIWKRMSENRVKSSHTKCHLAETSMKNIP